MLWQGNGVYPYILYLNFYSINPNVQWFDFTNGALHDPKQGFIMYISITKQFFRDLDDSVHSELYTNAQITTCSCPEVSLIVTDFTISLSSSSCIYLFFNLITIRSCYIYWQNGKSRDIWREKKRERENMNKKERIAWTAVLKKSKIRHYWTRLWEVVWRE